MARMQVELLLQEDEETPDAKKLMSEVVDPEIRQFESHFGKIASNGATSARLAPHEREVVRAFVWWLLKVRNG